MARDVQWDKEKPCFRTLAQTLAQFYSLQKPLDDAPHKSRADAASSQEKHEEDRDAQQARHAAATAAIDGTDRTSEAARNYVLPGSAGIETADAADLSVRNADIVTVVSNVSATQINPATPSEEDTVEAALAAQRPHPDLSASEPVGDAEVAQALESMSDAQQERDGRDWEQKPAGAVQRGNRGQPHDADGDVLMTSEGEAGTAAQGAAGQGTPAADGVQGTTATYEAEDERGWTIQHVRRGHAKHVLCHVFTDANGKVVMAAYAIPQVLFPAMRMFLKPNRQRASDGTFVELTRLERLYKVFERC